MSSHKRTIHFNAGVSKRVIEFIAKNYPKAKTEWIAFGDYSYVNIENMSDKEASNLVKKLRDIYPVELT